MLSHDALKKHLVSFLLVSCSANVQAYQDFDRDPIRSMGASAIGETLWESSVEQQHNASRLGWSTFVCLVSLVAMGCSAYTSNGMSITLGCTAIQAALSSTACVSAFLVWRSADDLPMMIGCTVAYWGMYAIMPFALCASIISAVQSPAVVTAIGCAASTITVMSLVRLYTLETDNIRRVTKAHKQQAEQEAYTRNRAMSV